VKALLMVSANHRNFPTSSSVTANGITYTANYDVFTVGSGYLDINAALEAAATDPIPAGSAMSPQAQFDPSTQNAFIVTSQTALWGSTALWGAENIYGSTQFLGGSTALWGAGDPQGFTALWGSTALWGAGNTNAATALWGADDVNGSTALWGASTADQSDPSTGGTVDWNATPSAQ
jgi:serine protease AprX